jgi:hypothetical protein
MRNPSSPMGWRVSGVRLGCKSSRRIASQTRRFAPHRDAPRRNARLRLRLVYGIEFTSPRAAPQRHATRLPAPQTPRIEASGGAIADGFASIDPLIPLPTPRCAIRRIASPRVGSLRTATQRQHSFISFPSRRLASHRRRVATQLHTTQRSDWFMTLSSHRNAVPLGAPRHGAPQHNATIVYE